MASPIFVSHPNPSFSLLAILKGCQFAFLGAYRLLQNQRFFEHSKYFKFTLFTLQISLVSQLVLSLPKLANRIIFCSLQNLAGGKTTYDVEKIAKYIDLAQKDLLNIPFLTILIFHSLYHETFDDIFYTGLNYIDQVTNRNNKRRNYSSWLMKTNSNDDEHITEIKSKNPFINYLTSKLSFASIKQMNNFSKLLSLYLVLTSTNLILFTCCQLPSRYVSRSIVSFHFSRFLNNKLGSSLTILIFTIGLFISPYIYIKLYSRFNIILLTVRTLSNFCYFQKLGWSDLQITNWMESRIGLIFGFGLVYHLAVMHISYISIFILMIEQLSLAFLIYKATDPIPDTITESWELTQLYWSQIYKSLTVTGEGFRPLPGSYLFNLNDGTTTEPSTPSASPVYITPVSSSANLSDLSQKL